MCIRDRAYSFDKPGSVIIGSTFAENISYPKHFNIVEKPNNPRVYSPIRIEGMDSELANRVNDTCMDFTKQELEVLTDNIFKDIKKEIDKFENKNNPKTVLTPEGAAMAKAREVAYDILKPSKKGKTTTKSKKSIDKILEVNNIKS